MKTSSTIESRRLASRFLLIWLSLAAIFIGARFQYYFLQTHAEIGDFAANGLQILNAKNGRELYGNYSRWGFHHPGPVFFYLYAAGEVFFKDLLRLVPSEFNSHQMSSVFIQTGLFVWALFILSKHISHRLFTPVILVAAALHFGAVNCFIPDSAFAGIWPPHVLLFPFFFFTIACASIASGQIEDILPAVVGGCLLVHGHVAQPLFVLPLFSVGLVCLLRKLIGKGYAPSRIITEHRTLFAGVVVVLAVSLLPIAIDALKGAESNLQIILAQFRDPSEDRQSFLESLAYLGTFLCYLPDPEAYCVPITRNSVRFFYERWEFTLVWSAVFFAALAGLSRARRQSGFMLWLYAYLLLATALTVIWGMLQHGGMANFNSHFNFGLIFILAVLAVVWLLSFVPDWKSPIISVVLYLSAGALFFAAAKGWHFDRDSRYSTLVIRSFSGLPAAAQQDSRRAKFLSFTHDDWPWAAGVALQLKRLGYDYAINPSWEFLFGRESGVDARNAIRAGKVSLWRIDPRPETEDAGFRIEWGPFVVPGPAQIAPREAIIRFHGNDFNANDYVISGWYLSSGPFSWSEGNTGLLCFVPVQHQRDVILTLDIVPATFPTVAAQRISVWWDETIVHTEMLSVEHPIVIRIPAALWNKSSPVLLRFEFPDATSPLEAGTSDDPRRIAFGFREIRFDSETP